MREWWSIRSEQMDDRPPRLSARARLATDLCGAAPQENLRSLPKNSDRAPVAACPLLPGALAVALGLVGVNLPHFLEQIFRVRPRNIRRARTAFVPLLRTPRSGIKRLLHALRHAKNLRRNSTKA